MKRWMMVAALAAGGCNLDFERRAEEHRLASRGLTHDDLTAPPSDHEIRARLTAEVRDNLLRERLDEGKTTVTGIKWVQGLPTCSKDELKIRIYPLRADQPDRQHPVEETVYYCAEDTLFWYHYSGGYPARDVWMGPFAARIRKGIKE